MTSHTVRRRPALAVGLLAAAVAAAGITAANAAPEPPADLGSTPAVAAPVPPAQAPRVVWREDFETGQDTEPSRMADYVSSSGVRYTADVGWFDYARCNGVVTNFDAASPIASAPSSSNTWESLGLDWGAPSFPAGLCTTGGYPVDGALGNYAQMNVRRMADVLGQVEAGVVGGRTVETAANGSTAITRKNHAVTAWTEGGTASGPVVIESGTLPIPAVTGSRYYTASVDVVEASCAYSVQRGGNSKLTFELLADGVPHRINATPIEACTSPTSSFFTSPMPGGLPETGAGDRSNWGNGGLGLAAGRQFTNDAQLISPAGIANLKVRMSNATLDGMAGNDFSFDNLMLLDVTPTLHAAFEPASVPVGESSTLTFTVVNTADVAAKTGWSFLAALPAGLTPGAATTTCLGPDGAKGGLATVAATAAGVTVEGSLAVGQETCAVTVPVSGAAAGTHVLGAGDIAIDGVLAPADATLEVVPGATASPSAEPTQPATTEPATTEPATSEPPTSEPATTGPTPPPLTGDPGPSVTVDPPTLIGDPGPSVTVDPPTLVGDPGPSDESGPGTRRPTSTGTAGPRLPDTGVELDASVVAAIAALLAAGGALLVARRRAAR